MAITATGASAGAWAAGASSCRSQNKVSMPRPSRRSTRSLPNRSAAATEMPATAARSRRVTSETDQPRKRRTLACRLRTDLEHHRVGAVARAVGAAGSQAHAALTEIDGLSRQVEHDRCRLIVDSRDGEAPGLGQRDYGPPGGNDARTVSSRCRPGGIRGRRAAEHQSAALAALLGRELHRLARTGDRLALHRATRDRRLLGADGDGTADDRLLHAGREVAQDELACVAELNLFAD